MTDDDHKDYDKDVEGCDDDIRIMIMMMKIIKTKTGTICDATCKLVVFL
jgi:hypothetical protein